MSRSARLTLASLIAPARARGRDDAVVKKLAARKLAWTKVSTAARADYLERCIVKTRAVGPAWVRAACEAKGGRWWPRS